MPGGKRKNHPSNPSAGKDFKKLKAKVGKRVPNAASHTSTDFKSARVVLPDQSILEAKTGAVTKRNLSLQDLLSQLQHYSVPVRKGAYLGLKELFTAHSHVLYDELSTIMSRFPKGQSKQTL